MDLTHIIDGVICKTVSDNMLWEKLDATKLSPAVMKKIVKTVIDVCSKCQYTPNMVSTQKVASRVERIRGYRCKLHELKRVPLVEQRSREWYEMRNGMITASDFGDALAIDKFGKKTDPNKIYEKKCGYEPLPEYDMASVFLKWGVMFEPVATKLYEERNGIRVHEFGLVQNPRYSFLGASPDGISDMGVMLEIKCPYKRVITEDSILKQYYYQIQGQLDACDLNECDFLEVRFDKYENLEQFWEDYETEFDCFTSDYLEKGIIIEKTDGEYMYSPYNASRDDVLSWYQKNNNSVFSSTFWYLHSFSIKRVYKDPSFVHTMNTQLEDVWNNIVKYRNDESLYIKEIKTKKPSRTTRTISTNQNTNQNTNQISKPSSQKRSASAISKNVGSMFIVDPNED